MSRGKFGGRAVSYRPKIRACGATTEDTEENQEVTEKGIQRICSRSQR